MTCKGSCSRYELAQEVLTLAGKTTELTEASSVVLAQPAVRPAYAVLDNFILRIIDVYDMPHWKDSLKEYIEERMARG